MADHPSFTYSPLPGRVLFGRGTTTRLSEELERLGVRRALVLSTAAQTDSARALSDGLGDRAAGVYANAVMHTPTEVTEDALRVLRELNADGLVALGGGSTIGLAKALALRTDLPQVALPTTYAGSEVTPIIGETEGGRKVTQRTLKVLPETVIYDVDQTLSLPANLSASSGMNAIAHAVEALYAPNGNPVASLMAEDAIRALGASLPVIVRTPADPDARWDALYGAWLAGSVLGSVGMSLHHKLAHVLGGTFSLPHAESHAALLPHAAAYNAPGAPDAMRRVARALGADGQDAPGALYDLNVRLGNATALRDVGMPEDGVELAADEAMRASYPNPVPLERDRIRDLLRRAWAGDRPA